MASIGEESGALDRMLAKVADFYEAEIDDAIAGLSSLIEPVIIVVLGSMIGSLGVFALLKGSYLAIFFGLFVGFSATQMFLDKKPAPTRQVPGPAGLAGAGGAIGFLSGLVGAGGGFISVPFMAWCNVAIHNAVAI